MENILLALELDGKAGKLLDVTYQLAGKFDSKIWIIHVAAPDPDFVGYEIGPQYIRDTRAEDLKEEHKMIRQIAHYFEQKNIRAEGLLIQGPTVKMLLEETEKLGIDLIIMGHREHSFLYKVFFGSTAKEVLKRSKIPLLVIPLE